MSVQPKIVLNSLNFKNFVIHEVEYYTVVKKYLVLYYDVESSPKMNY